MTNSHHRPAVTKALNGVEIAAVEPGPVRTASGPVIIDERSICSGALLLAETGVLDGRRATTHWASAADLAAGHPEIDVEPDQIYLEDGVWTSAGVTAGIDLALQLVRTHHGSEMAAEVGFGGPETFLRAFGRVVGVNPTEYRRRFTSSAPTVVGDGGGGR